MDRRFDRVKTPWGPVRVKVSRYHGRVMQATPEYEDCRALALKASVPLKEVQQAAQVTWERSGGRAAATTAPRHRPRRRR